MQELSRETLSRLKRDFDEFTRLCSEPCSPERPYEHKYAARALLQAALNRDLSAETDASFWISAHFLSRIALIDHEVEELSESEGNLKRTLEKVRSADKKDLGCVIIPQLVCLNQV